MSQFHIKGSSGGGGGGVNTLTGNDHIIVGPDGIGNINVVGDATYLTVIGNAGTNTETISPVAHLIVSFRSPLITFSNMASTIAFNIPHDFAITFTTVIGVSGTNVSGFTYELDAPGSILSSSPASPFAGSAEVAISTANQVVPANTNISVNIITADNPGPSTGYVYIQGFYTS